jgi:hypothetical protein
VKYLKKIVQEELRKALGLISEETLYDKPEFDVFEKTKGSNDSIIYNYELGREFASNTLQVDINNLNAYNITEYLPKSVNQEKWTFEFETAIGTILMVDIIRDIRGGISFWTMMFGIVYKGETTVTIKEMLEDVKGYDNFVDTVNVGIGKKIDPSQY